MASPPHRGSPPPREQDAAAEGLDFKAITEAAMDVILCCNLDAVATYVSPSIKSLIGLSPEELIGRRHTDYVHPEDKATLHRTAEVLAATKTDGRATFRMIRKDGSIVWVEGSGRSITNLVTGEVGFVIVLRDISDRKALEAQLSLLALTNATPPAVPDSNDAGERISRRPKDRSRGARFVN